MDIFVALWIGACLGSFVNVLVHRLPREQSVVAPGSRCPRCGVSIRFYDNVPVFGWLWLGGRCRSCRAKISLRYPLIELLTAVLCAGLWWRWRPDLAWSAAAMVVAAALVAVAFIDWDHFIIPDELSLGLLGLGLLASPINPLLWGEHWLARLGSGLLGAAAGFGMCWLTAEMGERLFKKEAMGGGDIKLMAAVGAWTGVLGAFDCLMIGSFLGAVYGLSLMARRRLKRSDPIPFGPFLSASALLNFFWLIPPDFLFRLTL
ncbi:MAG: prepilin peptidase [Elusimicrobia bacterium]|nr:prepilin peptidase [Elusimicrobiota bacterium]